MIPLAGAGLALINAGFARSRSAAHGMVASLCVFAVAAIFYVVFGFSWQGIPGGPAHVLIVGGKSWDWLGVEPFFLRGLRLDLLLPPLIVLSQMFSVGLAAMIPLGAGAERWKLSTACASTILLAGWIYPLFAHWVWSGGWLSQLGSLYGLGRGFVDGGGAATIHVIGGLSALSVAWILGPRRGKFSPEGAPAATPAHNVVLVLAGCLFAWVGWLGLNAAGSVLFYHGTLSVVALIGVNTTLSAAASALAAAAVTKYRFGRPDASLFVNGWMAGLVASSAAAAFLKPVAAILAGFISGILVVLAVDLLESRLTIDDPGGAISVHAISGLWGLVSVALLGYVGRGSGGQWLAQLVGIATLLGLILPLMYGLNWLADRVYPYRVETEAEWQGMDLYELGAGAYPEFVVHSDEFTQH